jgi:hypothetical protein
VVSSKSCAITSVGCAGVFLMLGMAPFALGAQGNGVAALCFAGLGAFAISWHRLARSRYEKGGRR